MFGTETHMPSDTVVVAIDGPAASGKSTVARILARTLGFGFLSSGDFYRTVACAFLRKGIDCGDPRAVASAAARVDIRVLRDGEVCHPLINGEDLRAHLRDEGVNKIVSPVAAVPEVRNAISSAIRSYASGQCTVIEGRDIGSAVFPETPFKFYLDASPQIRQRRRLEQGQTEEISRRDHIDSTRKVDPLKVAPGAVVVDTSELDVQGVVAAILSNLRARGLHSASTVSRL